MIEINTIKCIVELTIDLKTFKHEMQMVVLTPPGDKTITTSPKMFLELVGAHNRAVVAFFTHKKIDFYIEMKNVIYSLPISE
jgi:hypothetical protein